MNIVDLHVHSNKSDGTYSPTELVDYAIQKGLSAFALTDHDTISGLVEAISYAKSLKKTFPQNEEQTIPEVIPGIEFSTEYEGKDIHIVGLYIDYTNTSFTNKLTAFIDSRTSRNHKMCEKLQNAGMDITYDKLISEFPDAVITRAHYAKFLLKYGYVRSMNEAFERYLGDHASCFVPRKKVTPFDAVELILMAGGIPILAHPILYHMSNDRLDKLVSSLKDVGLIGIECIYPTYRLADERQMRKLALKYSLLQSGGSDFHGANKPGLDLAVGYGKLFIPEEILLKLKKRLPKVLFSDMDGTLLKDDCTISPALQDAICNFEGEGNTFVLTTGRPLPAILEVQEQQNISTSIVIAYNGALIYDCHEKKAIASSRLSIEDVLYIEREATAAGLHMHTFTEDTIVAKKRNAELEFYTRRIHMPINLVEDFEVALPQGPYKIQCISLDDKAKLEAFRQHISSYCEGKMQVTFSNDKFLEFLPLDAGKGNAVRKVCKHLHIPIARAYAVGDEENDISMLQAVGHAVAMANATAAVKEVAEIVTEKDNNNDGVMELLEK